MIKSQYLQILLLILVGCLMITGYGGVCEAYEPQYEGEVPTGGGDYIVYGGSSGELPTNIVPGLPPTVTTIAATNITSNSATLNGRVNPDGIATSAYLQWGTSSSYGNTTTSVSIGNGTSNINIAENLTGLPTNTTYYFRAVGTNSIGTTNYGESLIFTTGSGTQPSVTTNPATNITSNSATLNGISNPNGAVTTAYFEWGTSTSYGNTTTSQSIGGGISDVIVSAPLTGLSSNTTYNFRIVATNSGGTSYGVNLTFTTGSIGTPTPPGGGGGPGVTTNSATNITGNAATLNGIVNPNGVATNAYFQWGTSTFYGTTTPVQYVGSGSSNVNISAPLTGLTPGTTYYFRVAATDSNNTTTYGTNQWFRTLTTPTVTTDRYIFPTATSANLGGALISTGALGSYISCSVWFEYGLTASLGTNTRSTLLFGAGSFRTTLSGLTPNTIYYYRAGASNAAGTSYGSISVFVTPRR